MGDWEDGAGTDKAYDLFGLGRFPMKFVGSTLSARIGEWFSERIKVEGVCREASRLVGVRAGKTHFGGKSSALSGASPFVARALGWYADNNRWDGFRRKENRAKGRVIFNWMPQLWW
jgi:hypothetical protein